jgi:WD40 repeat protein
MPYIPESDFEMSGYPSNVKHLSWSSDSSFLATNGYDDLILWKFAGKSPVGQKPLFLKGHKKRVSFLQFQNNEKLIASGDTDGNVLFWQPEVNLQPLEAIKVNSEVSCLSWSPDDVQLAVGTRNGEIIILESPF